MAKTQQRAPDTGGNNKISGRIIHDTKPRRAQKDNEQTDNEFASISVNIREEGAEIHNITKGTQVGVQVLDIGVLITPMEAQDEPQQ